MLNINSNFVCAVHILVFNVHNLYLYTHVGRLIVFLLDSPLSVGDGKHIEYLPSENIYVHITYIFMYV